MRQPLRVFALVGTTLAACGGDGAPAGSPAPGAGDIQVVVRYAGTRQGALSLGAFTSVPPSGGPLAFQRVEAPAFPATVTLHGLPAGAYFVIATLDQAPASPTMPGPEDLSTASTRMDLGATAGAHTELELKDK